ncbi:MAG: hypothetical protein JW704_13860, partial [Anaerolineaceae bacterium]|nr:hypothetical protein [Anaerolineaceae bacterium]
GRPGRITALLSGLPSGAASPSRSDQSSRSRGPDPELGGRGSSNSCSQLETHHKPALTPTTSPEPVPSRPTAHPITLAATIHSTRLPIAGLPG